MGRILNSPNLKKDLGVHVQDDLKLDKQINEKGNNMVSIVKHTFTYLDVKSISILYRLYIKPHLNYCIQVWGPYLHNDMGKLECAQRRVKNLLPKLKNLPYHQRLKELCFTTLPDMRDTPGVT